MQKEEAMALINVQYQQVRDRIRPGDIIAFSGKSEFSRLIKVFTRSAVSHVGIVLQSELKDVPGLGYINHIIQSTILGHDENGGVRNGVVISRLSDLVNTYNGEMWWLPLAAQQRAIVDANLQMFYNWCLNQEGKQYDMSQVIGSALTVVDKAFGNAGIHANQEDFSKFFCSELAAAALEKAGAIPEINCSEVTPIDLCNFSIFEKDYAQIRGDAREIRGFNTVDPLSWAKSVGAGLGMAA